MKAATTILRLLPVSELRTCNDCTEPGADRIARRMHWRDAARIWRCEVCFPFTVEPVQELAPADPPSEQAQQETPVSVEPRDVAHAEAGGSLDPELRRYVVLGPYDGKFRHDYPREHVYAYDAADAAAQARVKFTRHDEPNPQLHCVEPYEPSAHGGWLGRFAGRRQR